jgi:dethiobiotin synthetase
MSLFITGTGTDVGKTVLTAGLAAMLRAQGQSFCVYKPIQTGSPDPAHPEDLERIRDWVGADVPVHCSYCFAEPVAPYAADPGRTIDPHQLLLDFKRLQRDYAVVLVEGAGGVRVPVAPHLEMIDLIRMYQLPVLVAACPRLGTLNHILLTMDALARRRIEVKGLVISGLPQEPSADPAMASLLETLEPFLTVPLLGVLPPLALASGVMARPEVWSLFQSLYPAPADML